MHYRVISTRITCLHGSQPSSVAFACKTATFGEELQVSMGPRPHLSFCAWKPVLLASEILVSGGASPHLWFLHAKERLLDQNYKSLWVPDLICHFVHAKQRDLHQTDQSIWVPALICVFFCMQNSDFWTSFTSLYGSQTSSAAKEPRPHLSLCACKTAWLASELLVSVGPSPHLWLLDTKQRLLDQNNKSPLDSDITYRFVHAKQRD